MDGTAAVRGAGSFAVLLGVAQDAGVPQAGCECVHCAEARRDASLRRRAASLGLIDTVGGASWLIDATPDFREQLATLQAAAPQAILSGILLTHAHMGHYLGLAHVGPEAMASVALPVYATDRMSGFLRRNAPWSRLVVGGHIELRTVAPRSTVRLGPRIEVEAVAVPHRDELSDTVAFVVRGGAQSLLYCPDVDAWSGWESELAALLAEVDVALLDATFFSSGELRGRDQSEVPHPLVADTLERAIGCRADVVLIHLNHTNPLLREGPEREWVRRQGAVVGVEGATWRLG